MFVGIKIIKDMKFLKKLNKGQNNETKIATDYCTCFSNGVTLSQYTAIKQKSFSSCFSQKNYGSPNRAYLWLF